LKKLLIAVLLLWATAAPAQMLHGVTDALSGGGAIIPPTCNGAIDLSKGCALPMLGGAP
jgi:hypothetical protein